MRSFKTWKEAHTAALNLARLLGHDTGVLKCEEFGRIVFNVYSLPKPEHRCGYELRCEVVRPTDAITD